VPKGGVVDLARLWALSGPWYLDRLDEGWMPKTAERTEALFTSAGLTGDFWRVR
jgi:hypothetical protein